MDASGVYSVTKFGNAFLLPLTVALVPVATTRGLLDHIFIRHNGELYECPLCLTFWADVFELNDHYAEKHPDKLVPNLEIYFPKISEAKWEDFKRYFTTRLLQPQLTLLQFEGCRSIATLYLPIEGDCQVMSNPATCSGGRGRGIGVRPQLVNISQTSVSTNFQPTSTSASGWSEVGMPWSDGDQPRPGLRGLLGSTDSHHTTSSGVQASGSINFRPPSAFGSNGSPVRSTDGDRPRPAPRGLLGSTDGHLATASGFQASGSINFPAPSAFGSRWSPVRSTDGDRPRPAPRGLLGSTDGHLATASGFQASGSINFPAPSAFGSRWSPVRSTDGGHQRPAFPALLGSSDCHSATASVKYNNEDKTRQNNDCSVSHDQQRFLPRDETWSINFRQPRTSAAIQRSEAVPSVSHDSDEEFREMTAEEKHVKDIQDKRAAARRIVRMRRAEKKKQARFDGTNDQRRMDGEEPMPSTSRPYNRLAHRPYRAMYEQATNELASLNLASSSGYIPDFLGRLDDQHLVTAYTIDPKERAKYKATEMVQLDGDDHMCTICLNPIVDGSLDLFQCHRCKAVFHKDCILDWLPSDKKCPLCRAVWPTTEPF